MEQAKEVESPKLMVSSPKSKGEICGATEKSLTFSYHSIYFSFKQSIN